MRRSPEPANDAEVTVLYGNQGPARLRAGIDQEDRATPLGPPLSETESSPQQGQGRQPGDDGIHRYPAADGQGGERKEEEREGL
jgi:hypothetical protein